MCFDPGSGLPEGGGVAESDWFFFMTSNLSVTVETHWGQELCLEQAEYYYFQLCSTRLDLYIHLTLRL